MTLTNQVERVSGFALWESPFGGFLIRKQGRLAKHFNTRREAVERIKKTSGKALKIPKREISRCVVHYN